MRVAAPVVVASCVALGLMAGAGAQEGGRVPTFEQAAEALAARVREAAPGLHVELNRASPEDLGWRAARPRTPARALVIMAPSGAARAYGLLPRAGTYTPEPDGPAQFVAVGPDLVVVGAHQLLQVALTPDALEAARPALERASAPLRAWEEAAPGEVDTAFVRGRVERAVKRPHSVEVDVAPGGQVDLPAAWKAGHGAVVYRVLRADGRFVAPTIAIAPR